MLSLRRGSGGRGWPMMKSNRGHDPGAAVPRMLLRRTRSPCSGSVTAVPPEDDRDRRELVRLVCAGILALLLVAFVVANSDSVPVSFIVTERRVPLIVVLVVTALLSSLVTLIIARRRHPH